MTQGKRIREARHRLQLTQIDLADRIGVHQPSVAYWESGKTRPRSATLLTLALALDVAPEWLEFGSSFSASDTQIPVVGALSKGAVSRPKGSEPDGSEESVTAGLDGSAMVAVRVSDDSLEPARQSAKI
jgi:transcriptional regulator with XRE-family HTH domain